MNPVNSKVLHRYVGGDFHYFPHAGHSINTELSEEVNEILHNHFYRAEEKNKKSGRKLMERERDGTHPLPSREKRLKKSVRMCVVYCVCCMVCL